MLVFILYFTSASTNSFKASIASVLTGEARANRAGQARRLYAARCTLLLPRTTSHLRHAAFLFSVPSLVAFAYIVYATYVELVFGFADQYYYISPALTKVLSLLFRALAAAAMVSPLPPDARRCAVLNSAWKSRRNRSKAGDADRPSRT